MVRKTIFNIFIGLALGIAATVLVLNRSAPAPIAGSPIEGSPRVVRDIGDVTPMTEVEVAAHRAQRFESLTSVEQILRLRSDFDQTEALYVLAGRSDSAEVQDLIHQTLRVADSSDRRAGLSILFARLTDIDPESAVAIAAHPPFTAERTVEPSIWRAWARSDLDAALLAASKLSPASRKTSAAEAIYGAHGYLGNNVTQRIEDALGVPPSQWIKSQYLQSLAADAPESAFDYLNELRPLKEQHIAAWVLGEYFGRNSPEYAESYASLILNGLARSNYEARVVEATAKSNPTMILDRLMADPNMRKYGAALASAISQLANTDLEQAMRYAHAAENQQTKMVLSSAITRVLARDDPLRALEWARENAVGQGQSLYQQAIVLVASMHPDIAMDAINNIPSGNERDSLTAMVVSTMAQSDPVNAIAILDQMPAGRGKVQAAQQLLTTWLQSDAKAAVSWAVDYGGEYGPQLLKKMSGQIIRQSPETAIQLLPRLDEKTASDWSVRIVQTLARRQSPAAAEAFMHQYKNKPEYARMQAALIPSVAQTDLPRAKQMADGMPNGSDRDGVYAQLVGLAASTDPHQAAAWIDSIGSEASRAVATSMLVRVWSQTDATSASRWVRSLPAGASRDDAISGLINSSADFSDSRLRLVESIGNKQKRSQAMMSYIYRLALVDPSGAESLLNRKQFTDVERTQLEQMLKQASGQVIYD